MHVCRRCLDFVQILGNGDVRLCAWNYDNVIGNLLKEDFYSIYHGEKANKLRKSIDEGTFEYCPVERCPFLANGTIKSELVEIDEVPEYPNEIYLAYDRTCNYRCTSCINCNPIPEDYKNNTVIIEKKLEEVLKRVKGIGANGEGELFACKSIMKLLGSWKPSFSADEINVSLETNGSLFNPENWEKIKNLGNYNLKVNVTIMSFEEGTYRFLSGTKLSVSNLEKNLKFIKKLREDNIINQLELATVMQEYNFREIPSLVRRCIEEFGADIVRVRPYQPWGARGIDMEWFFDVRNPYHPYYKEYERIMSDPIMQHPKVWKWANNLPSSLGRHPIEKVNSIVDTYELMLEKTEVFSAIRKKLSNKRFAMYGLGRAAKLLIRHGVMPDYIIDQYIGENEYNGIKIIKRDLREGNPKFILITLTYEIQGLKDCLQEEFHLDYSEVQYLNDFLGDIEKL